MKEICAKIGEHLIQFNCESESLVQFFQKNYRFISNVDNPVLIINVKDGYGVPFTNYDVDITKINNKIYYKRADYLIEVDSDYKVATIAVFNNLALKHAMMNLYSSFIVHNNWGLLIHSSCVIDQGKTHIFSGRSGAGKSTAAKLSYPRKLMADEATLIKISTNGIIVFDSPFRSELESEQLEEKLELTSIQLLNQALKNKRMQLSKSDALLLLMDKVFFWPHSQEETKMIMGLLTLLVRNVPVYTLDFKKDNTFWELIS